jgi:hypothetical protein
MDVELSADQQAFVRQAIERRRPLTVASIPGQLEDRHGIAE